MDTYKRRNKVWMVRVTNFPKEKRKAVEQLAESKRLSIGADVGNLLDEQIDNAGKEILP